MVSVNVPDETYESLRIACSAYSSMKDIIREVCEVLEGRTVMDKSVFFLEAFLEGETLPVIIPKNWNVDRVVDMKVAKLQLVYNPTAIE